MFGYIRPSMERLSEEERNRFSAMYCGLCRTLEERYGTAARFILNYDFVFLALLLAEPSAPEKLHRRCLAHPVQGRDHYVGNAALELCADCSVILAWWQLRDGIQDHGVIKGIPYHVAATLLDNAYRKARMLRPEFDRSTADHLKQLSIIEKSGSCSIDEAADTFAGLLSSVSAEVSDPVKVRILEQMLYHLGRWIYLVDAADDLADDFKRKNYNPLIDRFALVSGELTEEAKASLVISLDHSIRLISAAFELWDFGDWAPIIRSTVYEGLFSVGKAVLEGTFHAAKRNMMRGRDEEQL